MKTVSNSVRTIAPVGHTSRQPACTQCLQTSDIMSQRPPTRFASFKSNCSMNLTWRNDVADSSTVLSYELPESRKCWASSSAGNWFHSLQATSHALQPMQSVVSVKKPTGWPRWKVTGADGVPVPVTLTGCPGTVALPTWGWMGNGGACWANGSKLN